MKPEVRVATQLLGRGAQWNRLHPPVPAISIQPGDELLERTVTITYMNRHGFQTVLGGLWLAIQLLAPPQQILDTNAIRAPPSLPDYVEPEIIKGRTLLITQMKGSGPNAGRARITGRKATKQSPKTSIKSIYCETEI